MLLLVGKLLWRFRLLCVEKERKRGSLLPPSYTTTFLPPYHTAYRWRREEKKERRTLHQSRGLFPPPWMEKEIALLAHDDDDAIGKKEKR